MQITCYNDQYTWTVSGINMAAAKLRFALGFPEETFYCPKCGKGNKLTKAAFQAAQNAPQPGVAAKPPGPASPMPGVVGTTSSTARHGTVLARSLHVRKDHSTKAETMAGLVKGNKVDIIGTWSDGKNTWAQFGPERWSAIVYNGETLIQMDD
ncbi:MAG TPA: hypothetical protein VIU38_13930 [Anaerolineales bacterium]